MAGIAGVIHFDGGPIEPGTVESMTAAMALRGPDGMAHWHADGVALGHCQMFTTPEALEEIQPLTNEDASVVLVMDGRVDNWEELRAALLDRDVELRTRADDELVLRAYELWGQDCLACIDGDFALVIWDGRRREVFCARDRTGMKPFYYRWDNDRFIFGSELRAVLDAEGGRRALNEGFLAETLAAHWCSRDETLWQGVSRLMAARSMTVDATGPRISTYWHPDTIPLLRYKSDAEYQEHYSEVLFDSVRRLSRAIGPVGCDVSGGLDSSAIFVVADKLQKSGRLPASDVRGYTQQFEKGTDAYELDFAHSVGGHVGRTIEEVPPVIKSLDWFQAEAVKAATIPNFPNCIVSVGVLQRARADGCHVHLNGSGGDELLAAGGRDIAEAVQAGNWSTAAASIRLDLAQSGPRRTAYHMLRHVIFPLLPARVRNTARSAALKCRGEPETGAYWLSPKLRELFEVRHRRALKERMRRHGGLRIGLRQRVGTVENPSSTLIGEMLDRMASNVGVEQRSPFYDRRFVEMALGLPLAQLRRGNTNRWLHRRAMRGLLPEEVRNRSDKASFAATYLPCLADIARLQGNGEFRRLDWIEARHFAKLLSYSPAETDVLPTWPSAMLLCFALCDAIVREES